MTKAGSTLRYEASAGIRDLLTLSFPDAATVRFAHDPTPATRSPSVGCAPSAGRDIDCARAGDHAGSSSR